MSRDDSKNSNFNLSSGQSLIKKQDGLASDYSKREFLNIPGQIRQLTELSQDENSPKVKEFVNADSNSFDLRKKQDDEYVNSGDQEDEII